MSAPPIGTLLDYTYNAAHADHVHVEPPIKMRHIPPLRNPGMSPGVSVIYNALTQRFGRGVYFLDSNGRYTGNDPGVGWTHMGGWNRRFIGGTSTWSQHAYWNALDIGPYIDEAQQPFIDFLRGRDGGTLPDMAFTPEQEQWLKDFIAAAEAVGTTPGFVGPVVKATRALRRIDDIFEEEEF